MDENHERCVKEYYESVACEYDRMSYRIRHPYPVLRLRHEYILEMIGKAGPAPGARILDAGCGPGELVRDLAERGFTVWGTDIASDMIRIAEDKSAGNDAVHLAVGNVEQLQFTDAFFDVVVLAGVVEYLGDDTHWMREVTRVLKPGGLLILNVTNSLAVRKWTFSLVERIKRSSMAVYIMDAAKRKVLNKGALIRMPFTLRTHAPGTFDRLMSRNGYSRISYRFFDFGFLPAPLDTLLDPLLLPLRRFCQKRFAGRRVVPWGVGYLVAYRRGLPR